MSKYPENEEMLHACKQILHKSKLALYLGRVERSLAIDLPKEDFCNSETFSSVKFLSVDTISRDLEFSLERFLQILKHQTLVNGRLSSGSSFEEIMSKHYNSEKRRGVSKFSVLIELIESDLHTINNENIRFFTQMKLFPSILMILSSPTIRESEGFGRLFVHCYNIIAHLLECRGNVLVFSRSKEVLKLLIQILENLQVPLKDVSKQINLGDFFLNENNFSSSFHSNLTDLKSNGVLNCDRFLKELQSRKDLSLRDQESISIGILSKQLSTILKYFIQLVNVIDMVYVKIMANENDLEMVELLGQISTISSKSQLSQIALNRFLMNSFVIEAFFTLFNVSQLDHLISRQIEISLICEIFFNALIFDSGVLSMLHSKQICANLKAINDLLGQNQQKFEANRELRKYAILFINYMCPMETFMDEQKYGLNELVSQLKQKSFYKEDEDKSIRGSEKQNFQSNQLIKKLEQNSTLNAYFMNGEIEICISEFRENFFKFGNLDEPNQNLIFIDVSLKIFSLLVMYNPGIFMTFSESGLMSILDHLCKNFTALLEFISEKSVGPESLFKRFAFKNRLLNQYSSILKKIVYITASRFSYRAGFTVQDSKSNSSLNSANILSQSSMQNSTRNSHAANSTAAMIAMMSISGGNAQQSTLNSLNSNTAVHGERSILFKFNEYSEQIELLSGLYVAGYQFVQNAFELNLLMTDKSNWMSLFSSIISFFSNILDFPNKNPDEKFILRIEKAFSYFQHRFVTRIEDRPAIIHLLTALINLTQTQQQALLILSTITRYLGVQASEATSEFQIIESEAINQHSLIDTILSQAGLFKSRLIILELHAFFKAILGLHNFHITSLISNKILQLLDESSLIFKEFSNKTERKDAAPGIEYRKETESIIESMRSSTQILSYLKKCCENGGFKLELIAQQGDSEIFKLLTFIRQFEESTRAKSYLEITEGLIQLKINCLAVCSLLMDLSIGSKLEPGSKDEEQTNLIYSLIENIPAVTMQQYLFASLDSQPIEFPSSMLKRIWIEARSIANQQKYGSQYRMVDENNEQPDFDDQDIIELDARVSLSNLPRGESFIIQEISNTLDILIASSENIVGQTVLLYNEYVSYAYKSNPSLRLSSLTRQYINIILPSSEFLISQQTLDIIQTFSKFLYFIVQLTIHPITKQQFLSEKRKNAIKSLLLDEQILQSFEGDFGSSKQNESGLILEAFFKKLGGVLVQFQNEVIGLNAKAPSSIGVRIQDECDKNSIMVNYLIEYSKSIESRSNSQHDKNIDLPSEPRQIQEIFKMKHWTPNNRLPKNESKLNLIYRFIQQLTQSILIEIPENETILEPYQRIRFSNLFPFFYGIPLSLCVDSNLLSISEQNFEFNYFWDADCSRRKLFYSSKPNKSQAQLNSTVSVVRAIDLISSQTDNLQQQTKNQMIKSFAQSSTMFVDQFDLKPNLNAYISYGKSESTQSSINETYHLIKQRIFRESIQRTPQTRLSVETLKVLVRQQKITPAPAPVAPVPIPPMIQPMHQPGMYPLPPHQMYQPYPPLANIPNIQNPSINRGPYQPTDRYNMPTMPLPQLNHPMQLPQTQPQQQQLQQSESQQPMQMQEQRSSLQHQEQQQPQINGMVPQTPGTSIDKPVDGMVIPPPPPGTVPPPPPPSMLHAEGGNNSSIAGVQKNQPYPPVPGSHIRPQYPEQQHQNINQRNQYNMPPQIYPNNPPLMSPLPNMNSGYLPLSHDQHPPYRQSQQQQSDYQNAPYRGGPQSQYYPQPNLPPMGPGPGPGPAPPMHHNHEFNYNMPPPPHMVGMPPPISGPPPQMQPPLMNQIPPITAPPPLTVPPPPNMKPLPPPPSNPLSQFSNLSNEEKKIFKEKIEEIKILSKNKSDPRSNKKLQAILAEYPKLTEIISQSKQMPN